MAETGRRGATTAPADRVPGTRSGLLDGRSIRELAEAAGLRPSKQRGQNFVTDPNTVRRIVALSGVGPDDVVVEVGPGLGSLGARPVVPADSVFGTSAILPPA